MILMTKLANGLLYGIFFFRRMLNETNDLERVINFKSMIHEILTIFLATSHHASIKFLSGCCHFNEKAFVYSEKQNFSNYMSIK